MIMVHLYLDGLDVNVQNTSVFLVLAIHYNNIEQM